MVLLKRFDSTSAALRSSHKWKLALLVFATTVLTACPQKTQVWIQPGSSANNLVFVFGKDLGEEREVALGDIQVFRCADTDVAFDNKEAIRRAVWWTLTQNSAISRSRAKYGELISGFQTLAGPKTLDPDCYFVGISGTGETRFEVLRDGTITELPRRK